MIKEFSPKGLFGALFTDVIEYSNNYSIRLQRISHFKHILNLLC